MFQKALQFRSTIVLCYGRQIVVSIIGCVLPPLTWHISQIIIDVLSSIINVCVLNQYHWHWLLFYALNATITMSLKFKEDFGISFNLQDLIVDYSHVVLKLLLFASNIKREVCGVLRCFLWFFKTYEEDKTYNMLSFMLDPRFKNLRMVSYVIGWEQIVSIVEEYDQWSLFPKLLRCYHILHDMVEFGFVAYVQINEKNSLDSFWDVYWNKWTNKRRWWTRNYICLRGFKWMSKTSNVLLNGGRNMSLCFQQW